MPNYKISQLEPESRQAIADIAYNSINARNYPSIQAAITEAQTRQVGLIVDNPQQSNVALSITAPLNMLFMGAGQLDVTAETGQGIFVANAVSNVKLYNPRINCQNNAAWAIKFGQNNVDCGVLGDFVLENMQGNGQDTDAGGIWFSGSGCDRLRVADGVIRNITSPISNVAAGILVSGGRTATLREALIRGVHFENIRPVNDADGIKFQGNKQTDSNAVISHCTFKHIAKRAIKCQTPGISIDGGGGDLALTPGETVDAYAAVSIYASNCTVVGTSWSGALTRAVFDLHGGENEDFVVDPGTNTLTTQTNHLMVDGELAYVISSGTLPAGLSTNVFYYVGATTDNTCKLYTDVGLTQEVDITDVGSGTHNITIMYRGGAAKGNSALLLKGANNTDCVGLGNHRGTVVTGNAFLGQYRNGIMCRDRIDGGMWSSNSFPEMTGALYSKLTGINDLVTDFPVTGPEWAPAGTSRDSGGIGSLIKTVTVT